jgi:hypothetical protein
MKIAALITVAALTCGTAFAQSSGSSDSSAMRNHSAATASDSQPKGEGFIDKTKRAFHRLGEKLHASGNKSADTTDKTAQQDPENSTRAMGASGSAKSDSSRQSRMDQAYSDSKKSKSTDK